MAEQRQRTRRPDLSQHFLRSRALASKLVSRSGLTTADLVIEIGPGLGIFTRELASGAARVIAVEVDAILAGDLRERFAGEPRVEVVTADFLRYALPRSPYKVFGNIPFGITAAIVRRLTEAARPPSDAYLIMQREAAEKLAGYPWASESQRSLTLKPQWQVEIVERFRREDFEPPPAVDTVLLWLARRERPLITGEQQRRYGEFIAAAFGRRGHRVRDGLRPFVTHRQLRRLASDLRFDLGARPSALSFDQWLGLHRFIEAQR